MVLVDARWLWVLVLIMTLGASAHEEWCGDLGCYLEKMRVNFPNTTLTIRDRDLTACFESFTCSEFAVVSVNSSASGNETEGVFSVSFRPALSCNGTIQLASGVEAHGGQFRATVSPSTSLSTTVRLRTTSKAKGDSACVVEGVPDGFVVEHCEIHIRLAELKLLANNPEHQPFMDDLLNATQEAIEGAVCCVPLCFFSAAE